MALPLNSTTYDLEWLSGLLPQTVSSTDEILFPLKRLGFD